MKKSITILEDDRDIREICTYLLTDEGYNVNSYETIAQLYHSKIESDLFLLDIKLPDGNGLDVCNDLKSNPIYANKPIIMMSAHMKIEKMTLNCKADDFIEKPFDIQKLLDRVAQLID